MAQEIILSKDSSKNEIKAYFNAVLPLLTKAVSTLLSLVVNLKPPSNSRSG